MAIRGRVLRRVSRARWAEYRRFLEAAIQAGYQIESLETWVGRPTAQGDGPVLILRHDVDQQPAAVAPMAAVEEALGIRSTWYFRWRTAEPQVVSALRRGGHTVGLHYETLTRRVHELGLTPEDDVSDLIESCRALLREEIAAWARVHGRARSVCPHGDTGVPWLTNAVLMRGRSAAEFGVAFDSNEAMRGRGLSHWLTDRSAAAGGWADGVDPAELFSRRVSPMLCVSHPNNWSSGLSLWADRLAGRAMPREPDRPDRRTRPLRTGPDTPPLG